MLPTKEASSSEVYPVKNKQPTASYLRVLRGSSFRPNSCSSSGSPLCRQGIGDAGIVLPLFESKGRRA